MGSAAQAGVTFGVSLWIITYVCLPGEQFRPGPALGNRTVHVGVFLSYFCFHCQPQSFHHLRECHDTSSDSDHKFRKPLCCLQFKYYSLWPQHKIAPPPCHMCHCHLSSDTTFFTSSDVSLPPELRVRAQAQIMVILSGPDQLPIPQALAPTFLFASHAGPAVATLRQPSLITC